MKELIAVIIIIALITVAYPSVAQDGTPPMPVPPNAFYGNVTLNGQPFSVGSVIKAYVNSELRGSITITTLGKYGDALNYLSVDGGQDDEGEMIIFKIDGVTANETTRWHVMSPPRELDLHVWDEGSGDNTGGSTNGNGTTSSKLANNPPVVEMNISLTTVFIGQEILFDASGSYDPDGDELTYQWDFGDGEIANDVKVRHSYSSSGRYMVSLTVDDGRDGVDTTYQTITVMKGNYPPLKPTINGPTSGHKNTPYTYIITSTDPDNDTIQYTIDWGDSNKVTTEFLPNGGSTSRNHSWSQPGRYIIKVTAYDNETSSGITKYTVLIDVHYVNDIGYLIDNDSDGTYDSFYSNSTGKQAGIKDQDDGTYLIDNDGNSGWDYIYNADTDTFTKYAKASTSGPGPDNTALYVLLVVIILLFIIFGYLIKQSKDKKEAQKVVEKKQSQKKTSKSKQIKASEKKKSQKKTSKS